MPRYLSKIYVHTNLGYSLGYVRCVLKGDWRNSKGPFHGQEISASIMKHKGKNEENHKQENTNGFINSSHSVQFTSVTQSYPTLCEPMNCSTPGLPVHHQPPDSTQTHVHWVSDAIQPPYPCWLSSPPALNLSQHQGFFHLTGSSHQVAKVLELQLQHQSFQWISRVGFL